MSRMGVQNLTPAPSPPKAPRGVKIENPRGGHLWNLNDVFEVISIQANHILRTGMRETNILKTIINPN